MRLKIQQSAADKKNPATFAGLREGKLWRFSALNLDYIRPSTLGIVHMSNATICRTLISCCAQQICKNRNCRAVNASSA
jgi:hypothetical protein